MLDVASGTGGLVDSPAHRGAFLLAVLHSLSAADLQGLVVGFALVLDHADLLEVLLALLLLLGLEGGDVAGVAPLVVAVVAGDHLVKLSLLRHHDLHNRRGRNS